MWNKQTKRLLILIYLRSLFIFYSHSYNESPDCVRTFCGLVPRLGHVPAARLPAQLSHQPEPALPRLRLRRCGRGKQQQQQQPARIAVPEQQRLQRRRQQPKPSVRESTRQQEGATTAVQSRRGKQF